MFLLAVLLRIDFVHLLFTSKFSGAPSKDKNSPVLRKVDLFRQLLHGPTPGRAANLQPFTFQRRKVCYDFTRGDWCWPKCTLTQWIGSGQCISLPWTFATSQFWGSDSSLYPIRSHWTNARRLLSLPTRLWSASHKDLSILSSYVSKNKNKGRGNFQ